MGVHGIKNTILECAQDDIPRCFDVTIIDGSNVLCEFMRKVRYEYINKKRKIKPWNNVNYDLVTTVRMFLSDVHTLMKKYLMYLDSITNNQIILVFDLLENKGKKRIKIDESQINSIYNSEYATNENLNIRINEQNNAHTFQPDIKFEKSIESLDLSDNEYDIISCIYQQTSLLSNISNVIVFQNYIIYSLIRELNNDKFVIVHAIDNADFVIKRLAGVSNNVLVVSNDNDFYFMLCEYKNVFIALCNEDLTTARSPFYVFEKLGFNDFRKVIRASAFLGNDFTNHLSITKNMRLDEIANAMQNYTVDEIDNYIITHTSEEYAKGYIKSNLIYEFWHGYSDYAVVDDFSNVIINEELENALKHIYEEFIPDGYLVLWRFSPFCSHDWECKFFNGRNFRFKYFDDSDEFIDYVIGQ